MQVNPPADADEELLKKLSAINVGAGKTFDAALLGEGAAERWTQMLQGLRATLAADGAKYAQNSVSGSITASPSATSARSIPTARW